jgi:hypothetical protein
MRFEKALDQGPLLPALVTEWGRFTRYIEVGADRYALRHIDVFEDGKFLRYDRQHWIDAFGMLADARFGPFPSRSRRWRVLTIEATEFEAEWKAASHSPQWPLQVASAKMAKWGLVPVWLRPQDRARSPS